MDEPQRRRGIAVERAAVVREAHRRQPLVEVFDDAAQDLARGFEGAQRDQRGHRAQREGAALVDQRQARGERVARAAPHESVLDRVRERERPGVVLVNQRLAPARGLFLVSAVRGGRLPCGEVGALQAGAPPVDDPLSLRRLDPLDASRERAGRGRAEHAFDRERAEQMVLGRRHQVQAAAGRQVRLDVARRERVLLGRLLVRAVGEVGEAAMPGARGHERAAVPHGEARPVGIALDRDAPRHALHRAAHVGVLGLHRERIAHRHPRTHREARLRPLEVAVLEHRGVVPVDQEQRLLDDDVAGPVAPDRPRVEGERLEQQVARRARRAVLVHVHAEVEALAADLHALLELEQRVRQPAIRFGGHQRRVGAAGVRPQHGPRGAAAQAVGDQPLTIEPRLEAREDILS